MNYNIKIIQQHLGMPIYIQQISSLGYRLKYDTGDVKLEIFKKNPCRVSQFWKPNKSGNTVLPIYKLHRSLPIHLIAIEKHLPVPRIIAIKNVINNKIYKYSEWIEGEVVESVFQKNDKLIKYIAQQLGEYFALLYNTIKVTPVDNHLRNFVWSKDGRVLYIDMKKFLYCEYPIHILQIAKFCLKSCKGNKDMVINFLCGYGRKCELLYILDYFEKINWRFGNRLMQPITVDEIESCSKENNTYE